MFKLSQLILCLPHGSSADDERRLLLCEEKAHRFQSQSVKWYFVRPPEVQGQPFNPDFLLPVAASKGSAEVSQVSHFSCCEEALAYNTCTFLIDIDRLSNITLHHIMDKQLIEETKYTEQQFL